MDTIQAAVEILHSFRKLSSPSPACLFYKYCPGVRAQAFRLLSKKGLIEVAYIGGFGTKNWKPTAKAMSLRDGEEFSAIA